MEKNYIGDKRNILVAEDKMINKVVACVFWEIQEDFVRPKKTLYLTYLIVSAPYRRRGIAHLLCSELDKMCTNNGCEAIELTSANYRSSAHALYKSMGYTIKDTSVFIKEV